MGRLFLTCKVLGEWHEMYFVIMHTVFKFLFIAFTDTEMHNLAQAVLNSLPQYFVENEVT